MNTPQSIPVADYETIALVDGVHVEYQGQDARVWKLWDRVSRADFHGRDAKVLVLVSTEFASMSYDAKGRRVFTAPRWYLRMIGLPCPC